MLAEVSLIASSSAGTDKNTQCPVGVAAGCEDAAPRVKPPPRSDSSETKFARSEEPVAANTRDNCSSRGTAAKSRKEARSRRKSPKLQNRQADAPPRRRQSGKHRSASFLLAFALLSFLPVLNKEKRRSTCIVMEKRKKGHFNAVPVYAATSVRLVPTDTTLTM